MMEQYGYITFKSVTYAMKFESAFKNHEVKIKIIPVPRSISTSCGLCIRFSIDDLENIETIINENKLEYSHIHTNI